MAMPPPRQPWQHLYLFSSQRLRSMRPKLFLPIGVARQNSLGLQAALPCSPTLCLSSGSYWQMQARRNYWHWLRVWNSKQKDKQHRMRAEPSNRRQRTRSKTSNQLIVIVAGKAGALSRSS
jgi:hypothetical protein